MQVYGHQKFKTGAIRSYGNVIVYASDFGGKWPSPGTILDEPNAMFDNRVWFQSGGQYHGDTGWTGNRSYNNHLVGQNVKLSTGETLSKWQAQSPKVNDVGTTYRDVDIATQAAEMQAAARDVLQSVLAR